MGRLGGGTAVALCDLALDPAEEDEGRRSDSVREVARPAPTLDEIDYLTEDAGVRLVLRLSEFAYSIEGRPGGMGEEHVAV